jgi:hypothetical protein
MSKTTAFSLDPRAKAFVAKLPETDPLVISNALIDEANECINLGLFDEAEVFFAAADAYLYGEV